MRIPLLASDRIPFHFSTSHPRFSPFRPCWRSEDVTWDDPTSSTELRFELELPGILALFRRLPLHLAGVRYSRGDETALRERTSVYLCETTNEIWGRNGGLIAKPFRTLYGVGFNASQTWKLVFPVEWNWTDNGGIVSAGFWKSRIMTANSRSTTIVATDSRRWKGKTDVWWMGGKERWDEMRWD